MKTKGKTKLEDLEVKKIDAVDIGADQKANILIKKRGGAEEPKGNFFKRFFNAFCDSLGVNSEDVRKSMEDEATSFDDVMNEKKIYDVRDQIWNACNSLEQSIVSILLDKECEDKQAAIAQSIDQFKAFSDDASKSWIKLERAVTDKEDTVVADDFEIAKMQEVIEKSCDPETINKEKKEKENEARDRNFKEHNQILGYIDKLKDILHGNEVIKSKDADAVEMLQEKLDKLVENQNMMKAVNAYYRKHKTLKGCPEFSEETAIKLEESLDDRKKEQHRVFMRYELQNNNSNIRSIKKRLEALKREKEQGDSEISLDKFGLDIKENKEIMRIQFFFSGRPKPAVRDVMKSKSFRWSPKNGCWQRQLTSNGRYAAKKAVEEIEKLELEDIYDEI